VNDSFVSEPHLPRPLPIHTDGMRIGLLGGSFNPPHEAHRAISLFALKRLKLDRIWWLVSPGNPLKNNGALHALRERMTAAEKVANDPRIDISCLETVIGTRYTADTISYLRAAVPACALSGSWALTIWLSSTAGSAGRPSPAWCRLRWLTARPTVSAHSPPSPHKR
jgi:hypothetical protein